MGVIKLIQRFLFVPCRKIKTGLMILHREGFSEFLEKYRWWRAGLLEHYRNPYHLFLTQLEPNAGELARQRARSIATKGQPQFSLLTVATDADAAVIAATLRSLRKQSYPHWTWTIAVTGSGMRRKLALAGAWDRRIRCIVCPPDQSAGAARRQLLEQAGSDWIAFVGAGDQLAPHALYEFAEVIREQPAVEIIYSDSDRIDRRGLRSQPSFKPGWGPEQMLSHDLFAPLAIFRRSLRDQAGRLNPDLSYKWLWDWHLKLSERATHVRHIPRLLYHVRLEVEAPENPVATAEIPGVLRAHLVRQGLLDPKLEPRRQRSANSPGPVPPGPVLTWRQRRCRRVSIIIPSRDLASVLERCLETLFELTTYADFHVVVVDNGSVEPETFALYNRYRNEPRFRLVTWHKPFNFGSVCNYGTTFADGELLLFLNNDVEVLHGEWLDRMVQWFERPGVGVVGPQLLFPDGRIQHAGVIIGMGGLAGHVFAGATGEVNTPFGGPQTIRNFAAVTGACQLVSREAFEHVGGWDEGYRLIFSDVELCLRIHDAGYRIVYTPDAQLIHHESLTHQLHVPRADILRANDRWRNRLRDGDPFYNVNLTYADAISRITLGEHESPGALNHNLIRRLPLQEIIHVPDDLLD